MAAGGYQPEREWIHFGAGSEPEDRGRFTIANPSAPDGGKFSPVVDSINFN